MILTVSREITKVLRANDIKYTCKYLGDSDFNVSVRALNDLSGGVAPIEQQYIYNIGEAEQYVLALNNLKFFNPCSVYHWVNTVIFEDADLADITKYLVKLSLTVNSGDSDIIKVWLETIGTINENIDNASVLIAVEMFERFLQLSKNL